MGININNILGDCILAPMAGITGFPFRKIALKYGASFCYTEMISAIGYLHNDKSTLELTAVNDTYEKTGIQLFGFDPDIMGMAAKKAVQTGFKAIDINFGCPVKKVIKTGAGSAALKDLHNFAAIIEKVRKAVEGNILTIKIRSGFDENSKNFNETCHIAESAGVGAIFFHPRTRSQMFSGKADHNLTKLVKNSVRIPVYATGDIFTASDAINIKNTTGVDGVLFARGAIGHPWIFKEYLSKTKNKIENKTGIIDIDSKINIFMELIEEMNLFYGRQKGYKLLKPHLYNFLSGFNGSKALRCDVNNAKNSEEIMQIIKSIKQLQSS
jgi:nifR3 family TIM-barrel protein